MWLMRNRKIVVGYALIVVCLAMAGATVLRAQTPKRLALVGGMLLTGYEVPPIHHAAVLIEGSKIVAAGPASEIKIPADATVVDTSGRTILPGLIETHGHLIVLGHGSYDTWFPWIKAHGGDTMLRRVMEISARQLLMAGVTTTIDLGAPLQPSLSIRDRINKGELVGSRVFVSGPWISRGAGGAMQEGFGGINISTPRRSRAGDRPARRGGRRSHQGARGPDARRLQGDCRRRAQARDQGARACLRRSGRPARARGRRRRSAARRIGGHCAPVQQRADYRRS